MNDLVHREKQRFVQNRLNISKSVMEKPVAETSKERKAWKPTAFRDTGLEKGYNEIMKAKTVEKSYEPVDAPDNLKKSRLISSRRLPKSSRRLPQTLGILVGLIGPSL